jgi:hypothetical protein
MNPRRVLNEIQFIASLSETQVLLMMLEARRYLVELNLQPKM